jgi:hypothetical protein
MVTYGLNLINRSVIVEKAKSKNDGVFEFRGVMYRVRNFKVTHFADNGEVLEPFVYFDVSLGKYDTREDGRKLLKSIN